MDESVIEPRGAKMLKFHIDSEFAHKLRHMR